MASLAYGGIAVVVALLVVVLYMAVRAAASALIFMSYLAISGVVSAAASLVVWVARVAGRPDHTT